MKKHIKLLTIGTLLLGGLTGCNDFLDREPLDKVIPEKYFASESDLAAYTINAYPFETVTDAYGINFFVQVNGFQCFDKVTVGKMRQGETIIRAYTVFLLQGVGNIRFFYFTDVETLRTAQDCRQYHVRSFGYQ